jgi:hypothetical protein
MMPPMSAPSPLWVALCVLAVWRLTALVCYDRGPFGALTLLRGAMARAGLHRVFTCFHCAAVWVALGLTGVAFGVRWRSLLIAIALAGGASVIERWLGGPDPAQEDERHV